MESNNNSELKLELSLKDIRKIKGEKNPDNDKFQIICQIESDQEITSKQWAKGKLDIDKFKARNSDKTFPIQGDRFNVRHAGNYTAYIRDEAGNETVETITIKHNKVIVLFIPIVLATAATLAGLQAAHIINLPIVGPQLQITGKAQKGMYHGKTRQEILDDLKKQEVMVTDTVSSSMTFLTGKKGTEGAWIVDNIKTNKVIMQADVIIQGKVIYKTVKYLKGNEILKKTVEQAVSAGVLDGKQIAESVPIYPGEHISGINLSKTIPAGTYSVVGYINYYNAKTLAYISKAGYRVKMVVKG